MSAPIDTEGVAAGTPGQEREPEDGMLRMARMLALLLCAGVVILVLLKPEVAYAQVSRTVVFWVIALLPAILFGAQATTLLEYKTRGLVASTTGAAALFLLAVFGLHELASQEQHTAVFDVFDARGEVSLESASVLQAAGVSPGGSPRIVARGNTLVLIFPHGVVPEAELRIQPTRSAGLHVGTVGLAEPGSILYLGDGGSLEQRHGRSTQGDSP